MREVAAPQVYVVARTVPDYQEMHAYLDSVKGASWLERKEEAAFFGEDKGLELDGQDLVEFAGRLCYRSWEPGLNPNVTKVRTDQVAYLNNILKQAHGSVLEHVTYSFVFHEVSRVFTHEACRHRAGVAISQESMRYVRLTDIPFWFPEWARQDKELMSEARMALHYMEVFQAWMSEHFRLDDPDVPFHEKKHKTSFMRRFAPDGVATGLIWTANLRELRHVITTRTDPGAEEEIRLVFSKVAEIMTSELPAIFGDFSRDTGTGAWLPEHRKV